MRKQYSPAFKAKVVLELPRKGQTLNQLRRWRQQAIGESTAIISRGQQV